MMLNCYKPLAAPRQDEGKTKDGKVSIGDDGKHKVSPATPAAGPTPRLDQRGPYDMRQVKFQTASGVHEQNVNGINHNLFFSFGRT